MSVCGNDADDAEPEDRCEHPAHLNGHILNLFVPRFGNPPTEEAALVDVDDARVGDDERIPILVPEAANCNVCTRDEEEHEHREAESPTREERHNEEECEEEPHRSEEEWRHVHDPRRPNDGDHAFVIAEIEPLREEHTTLEIYNMSFAMFDVRREPASPMPHSSRIPDVGFLTGHTY